ncbi:MAG: FAD-dependent oxidoreductase [Candidatus Woesearchaeota archaeon]
MNIILGAGPAGMSALYELHKNNIKAIVIEKEDKIGGLAKTLIFKEKDLIFRTDIGPHRFFSKNKYLYDMIEELLGNDWILVKRKTRQYIEGKFYDYPINALQAFKNIGLIKSAEIGLSYLESIIKYRLLKNEIKNFEDYIEANFGKKLGNFNMLNYTEKIWGIPCNRLHADWAKQRIKGLSLTAALKNAIFKQKGPKTLVDAFYYPKYGTGTIYETIAKKTKATIHTNSYPLKIYHNNKKILKIDFLINGKKETISPLNVISSIPITIFLNLLEPLPNKEVIQAANNLKWRSQVYLFITLNKKQISEDNWIYFPNKEIPFARISEMKNFSKEMSPKDKTSLFVEYFVYENDKIWNMNKNQLFELTMKHLQKTKLISKKDVRNYYLIKKKFVYPVYDLEYEKNLETIKKYLNQFDNLYYVGRPGRYQYTNQDHSLEMGILAAKSIIDGKKYDIDKIGSEKEYFEKGVIKNPI